MLAALVAEKKKCRPSGRNQGKRCEISPGRSLVTGLAIPPPAETRTSGPFTEAVNRITPPLLPPDPSGSQDPPRPPDTSARVSTAPPTASIRWSLPPAKNPIDLL